MGLAQALQSDKTDAVGKPEEPSLNVGRKGRNLRADSFVQDFHLPGHSALYLIFEIGRMPHILIRRSVLREDSACANQDVQRTGTASTTSAGAGAIYETGLRKLVSRTGGMVIHNVHYE